MSSNKKSNKSKSLIVESKSQTTIHERDAFFLLHVKERGYIFDCENGIIYKNNGVEVGTRGKKAHMLFFMYDKKPRGVTRSRAIWLYTHGFVPEGFMPSHISKDKYDDSIKNLELKTTSERSKVSSLARKTKGVREKYAKMTVEAVTFARKKAREVDITYTELLKLVEDKIGTKISKTTLIFAVQGRTFADVTEELPVLHKSCSDKILKEKKPRIRKKKESPSKITPVIPNLDHSIVLAKSLLKNNQHLSDKAILRFLTIRNLPSIPLQKLTNLRRQVREIKKESCNA